MSFFDLEFFSRWPICKPALFNTAQHSGDTYSFLKVVCSRVFTCERRCMSYTCCSMGCYVAPEKHIQGTQIITSYPIHGKKCPFLFPNSVLHSVCIYLLQYTFKSWMNAPASPSEARELKRGTGKPPSLQYSNSNDCKKQVKYRKW